MKKFKRLWIALAAGMTLSGVLWTWLLYADSGPLMWWVTLDLNPKRVLIHWDQKQYIEANPPKIARLLAIVRNGNNPLPYSTRCLDDEKPQNWSLTFQQKGKPDFSIWIGLDGCDTFYVPSIGSSYQGHPDPLNEIKQLYHVNSPWDAKFQTTSSQ